MALSLPAPWYKNILQCRQLLVLCGERAGEEQGLHWVVRWQNMICDYAVQLSLIHWLSPCWSSSWSSSQWSFISLGPLLVLNKLPWFSILLAELNYVLLSSSSTSISKIILIMIITIIIITILSNIIVIVGININGNQQLVLFKSPQTLMKIENLSPNNNFPILVTFTAIIVISSIFPFEHIYKISLLSKGKQC